MYFEEHCLHILCPECSARVSREQGESVLLLQERKSVLIFCGTVARVEQTAKDIAKMCSEGLTTIHERSTLYNSGASPSKRAEFIANLSKNTPETLRLCISHGVGYHHGSTCSLSTPPCVVLESAWNVYLRISPQHPVSGGSQPSGPACHSPSFVVSCCPIDHVDALACSPHATCSGMFEGSVLLMCRDDD